MNLRNVAIAAIVAPVVAVYLIAAGLFWRGNRKSSSIALLCGLCAFAWIGFALMLVGGVA